MRNISFPLNIVVILWDKTFFMLAKNFKYLLIISILITACAKRGTINGGLKDTISPMLKISTPKNYSTDFKGNTIKLTFDEYIKLKNINKQLVISPPMKTAPEIQPTTASRQITIKIKDTLLANTTYSLNFGQSIEDNNEGNPYRQFKYVFSTGSYIDSLSLSGTVKDAYNKNADSFVTVALYEIDDKYNDSVIYNEIPRYVTNTVDSAKTFKLENLKSGKYLLVALKDLNSNFKFDPKTDKVGFQKDYISIPNDTIFEVELFTETPRFKAVKPTQASGNRFLIGYEGNANAANVVLKKGNDNISTIVTKFPNKDSLQVWYQPIKLDAAIKSDSLNLIVSNQNYSAEFNVRIKSQKNDTLSLTPNYSGALPLREKFAVIASVPVTEFDTSKMKLQNKDSVAVSFTTNYDEMKQEVIFDFKKEPLEKYELTLFPGAIIDYMQHTIDTITYKLETLNTSDYGNLRINLENVEQYPIIVELTNSQGEIAYSEYMQSNTQIDFNLIKPAPYTIRVIYDENKNEIWDSGNFLGKRQAEEVIYFPKEIDVRANWDVEQAFNLKP